MKKFKPKINWKNKIEVREYLKKWKANHNYHYPEYQREYLKQYQQLPEQHIKFLARQKLNTAIQNGKVIKPTRADCFSANCLGRIEAHHEDYSKPYEVKWLCKKHHELSHHYEKI